MTKLLYVEDNDDNVYMLKMRLELLDGFEVLTAENGERGYEAAVAEQPDIILMDEPFSALDIQTRQLMENEVLELWADKKKAVLFITHDLDEGRIAQHPADGRIEDHREP